MQLIRSDKIEQSPASRIRAMKTTRLGGLSILYLAAIAATAHLGAQSTGACAGIKDCVETRDLVSTVTDFRYSQTGSPNSIHILTGTIRFTNKSSRPIVLGYVNGSGIATDDQGNRYGVLSAASVRGIGIISGNKADTKFSLQPREGADARFELGWRADSRKIFGTSYTLEMTVREIQPINSTQLRLGQEYALRFAGLTGDGQGLSGTPATVGVVVAQNGAAPQTSEVASNACAAVARCYDAGTFSAVVSSMTGSMAGSHHVIDMSVRFTNRTAQPIILAYTLGSSALIDNLGNRYYWGRAGTHDNSVKGIGAVSRSSADPQFVLRPGESRDAKFSVIRYEAARKALGTSFSYDVGIEQLEVLAGQQVRPLRQYAVHFDNLTTAATVPSVENVKDAVNKLKGLFRKP